MDPADPGKRFEQSGSVSFRWEWTGDGCVRKGKARARVFCDVVGYPCVGSDRRIHSVLRGGVPDRRRTAYFILHDRQRAEDVAQEAFAQLYTHWKKVAGYQRPDDMGATGGYPDGCARRGAGTSATRIGAGVRASTRGGSFRTSIWSVPCVSCLRSNGRPLRSSTSRTDRSQTLPTSWIAPSQPHGCTW